MQNIVALKELRENMEKYVNRVSGGDSFIVFKKSKPIFKISPVNDGDWEQVIDFTKIKKGGVDIKDILSRL
jgi:prevent-host-death family protein